jgi:hypothetical protein
MRKAIIAAVLMGMLGAQGQTVLVRNKPVDLTPVVKWLGRKEGERPMPHWKVIEIESLRGKGWGGYLASAKVDGKEHPGTMVIQNIPATLLQLIAADDAALKAMTDIEARIEVIERQNLELERQKELTVREYSNTYEITLAQLRANEQAIAELRVAHMQQMETLRYTSEAKKSKLLAHFTGQKFGEHEVWDCGIGSKVLTVQGLE